MFANYFAHSGILLHGSDKSIMWCNMGVRQFSMMSRILGTHTPTHPGTATDDQAENVAEVVDKQTVANYFIYQLNCLPLHSGCGEQQPPHPGSRSTSDS